MTANGRDDKKNRPEAVAGDVGREREREVLEVLEVYCPYCDYTMALRVQSRW